MRNTRTYTYTHLDRCKEKCKGKHAADVASEGGKEQVHLTVYLADASMTF